MVFGKDGGMTKDTYRLYTYVFDLVLGLDKKINSSKTRFEPSFFLASFSFFMPRKIVHVCSAFFSGSKKIMRACSAFVCVLGSGYDECINSACRGIRGPL